MKRGSQTPRVANYPPYVVSAAPEVIALSRRARLFPDPWQQYVLTHGLGMDAAGNYTAKRIGAWVPRQNGKGGIIEALELAWLFHFQEREIVHSAHQQKTAMKAYRRMEMLIRGVPALHRLVRPYGDKVDKPGYRKSHDEQGIELHDGRLLQYSTRSDRATRGFSSGKLILDEAQELTEDQIAAIMPTMSAIPNSQAWFFGTPPNDSNAWCYNLREDGENGVPRLAWFDWGAGFYDESPECRALIDDPETAWACNPAMGYRITGDTVEDERRPSGLGERYPFERLGMWRKRSFANTSIDAGRWASLADVDSRRHGDVALAIDVSIDRDWAAIAVFGKRDDGLGHGQIIGYMPGTDWVVPKLAELRKALNPVAIGVARGTHATLQTELSAAGFTRPEDREKRYDGSLDVRRGDLAVLSAADMAAGCGQIIDAVRQASFRYVPFPPLERAALSARTRSAGDGIAWVRTDQGTDITCWSALTEARWAYHARVHIAQAAEAYDPVGDLW